jgi:hypothetical protein
MKSVERVVGPLRVVFLTVDQRERETTSSPGSISPTAVAVDYEKS